MKIVHTSDWHLGKKLKNRERITEQREVLNSLVNYVENNNVDLVIIAGDVYDTYSPPAEAEELFFNIIKQLSNGKRAVLVISGNHDDSDRLYASSVLAESYGVYFAGAKLYKPQNLERIKLLKITKIPLYLKIYRAKVSFLTLYLIQLKPVLKKRLTITKVTMIKLYVGLIMALNLT